MALDSYHAGAEAAAQAQIQGMARLLLVFCSSLYDIPRVLAGICASTPDEVLVVGGTSMGEIAEGGPGLEDLGLAPAVVVIALGGPGFQVSTCVARAASTDRRACGAESAAAMSDITSPHRIFIMIADGLTREQHELVRGAYSALGAGVPIVGGCSADNVEYRATFQFHGTGAGVEQLSDSVVSIGIGSTAPIGVGIAHGWVKHGDAMVVTDSEGGEIFQLDGQPALDVYLKAIGADPSLLDDIGAFRDTAMRRPFGLSRRSGEDLRVVHSANRESGSILCLADVPQGALAWTMSTDPDALINAAARSCEMAAQGLDGAAARGFVLFDCGARKISLASNVHAEQAAIARQAAGAPFGGFYTYGEIGRLHGARGMHQLTVVSLALA